LKKVLMYLATAVLLGLLLASTPLILFTEIKTKNDYAFLPEARFLEEPEERRAIWGLGPPKYPFADFGVLLTCFAIASAVYVFFKHRLITPSS